jgi:uncharacterized membrane protein (UPF0127 family)
MKLINKNSGKVISPNLKIASGWLEASLGLLNQPKGTAMLFNTRWGIHTFGMKYPIDVIVLDSKYKIVRIKFDLKPNRFFFWNPSFTTIIELPTSKSRRKKDLYLKVNEKIYCTE